MKEKDFMVQNENSGEKRKYVIEKIRRISVQMDRGESWTLILLAGLLAVVGLGLVYYLFF